MKLYYFSVPYFTNLFSTSTVTIIVKALIINSRITNTLNCLNFSHSVCLFALSSKITMRSLYKSNSYPDSKMFYNITPAHVLQCFTPLFLYSAVVQSVFSLLPNPTKFTFRLSGSQLLERSTFLLTSINPNQTLLKSYHLQDDSLSIAFGL